MKKIITTMFLSVILIIATIGFTSASGNVPYEEHKTEAQLAEEMRIYGGQTKAEFEARGEIMAKSAKGVFNEFLDKYTDDQYGGLWFDDEGYMNIYLLEESKALESKSLKSKAKIAEQKSMVSKNENVKVHYGKYSLAELDDAKEEISTLLSSKAHLFHAYTLSANESMNRVFIQLPIAFRDSNDKDIVALRNQLEDMDIVAVTYTQEMDDMPTLEEMLFVNYIRSEDNAIHAEDEDIQEIPIVSKGLQASYNVWLGMPVEGPKFYYNGELVSNKFSLGYATKDKYGTIGWITAGHPLATSDPVYHWSNGAKMGTCSHSIYDPDKHPEYDLAFVVLENHGNTWIPKGAGNFSGDSINNGVNLSGSDKWIKLGLQTCIEGRGGHTYGVILDKSFEVRVSGKLLTDRIKYSNNSWQGHSGGTVWTYEPDEGHKTTIVAINNGGVPGEYAFGTNVKYVKKVYGGGQLYTE